MRNIRNWSALILALATGAAFAQDATPSKFYRLDFVVKEIETGKVLNARSYSVTVSASGSHNCSIRTGSRVPYSTGKEYTYLDVGVSIDCYHVKEAPDGLALDMGVDISSALQESTNPPNLPPIVRQNKWGSTVIVPLRKATVVFSSDDVTTKRQTQLE